MEFRRRLQEWELTIDGRLEMEKGSVQVELMPGDSIPNDGFSWTNDEYSDYEQAVPERKL